MSIIGLPEVCSALNSINSTLKELIEVIKNKEFTTNNYKSHFIQYTDRLKGDEIVGPHTPPFKGPIC